MKRYRFYTTNRNTDDPERAVLPTIIYCRTAEYPITCTLITIGWWAWSIGFVLTEVKERPGGEK